MDRMLKVGFAWGLLATLAMTVIMLLGTASGVSPMPEPVPLALAGLVLASAPTAVQFAAGMVAHFGYGAVAGALFARGLRGRAGITSGLAFGVLLWLVMQLAVLPLLGWGAFGMNISPRVALATLLLHLVYGGLLGWGIARHRARGTVQAV